MKNFATPWGVAQEVVSYHPYGKILRVETGEHGGIAVALDLPMPQHLAAVGMERDGWRWFEENEAWAAAVTAFPSFFHPEHVLHAKEVLRDYMPEAFTAHYGIELTAATSKALARRDWEAATTDKFVVITGYTGPAAPWEIPAGQVYVCGWRRKDEAAAGFLVPAEIYKKDPGRMVLDGFPRWEPDRSVPSRPVANAVEARAQEAR